MDAESVKSQRDAWDDECSMRTGMKRATHIVFLANIMVILFLCHSCHLVLGRLRLPKIISELAVGLITGLTPHFLDQPVIKALPSISTIASSTYMFVLGLEMDPRSLIQPLGLEAKIAYAGMVATFASTVGVYLCVAGMVRGISDEALIFMVTMVATSSPLVTRMATELKIGKSEIGRQSIRTGIFNDMACVLIAAVISGHKYGKTMNMLTGEAGITSADLTASLFVFVAFEMLLVSLGSRFVVRRINERNPEGRAMNGGDMLLVVVLTLAFCSSGFLIGWNAKFNSFLVGLCLPREGRVSNIMISRTNYALSSFVLPLYLSLAGYQLRQSFMQPHEGQAPWLSFLSIAVVSMFAKLLGTAIAARWWVGMHWLEVITLTALVNIKGYFHIFMIMASFDDSPVSQAVALITVGNIMVSIVLVPVIVKLILRHVRVKSAKARPLGLQWYNPESDLRVMVGLYSPQQVRAAVGLIEMMREAVKGMIVHAVDMVELTSRAEATLVYGQGTDGVTVKDAKIVEMRAEIGDTLNAYGEASGYDGLRLRRSLAISAFANMHEDICCTAQDNLVAFIVLPFHKLQLIDGSMDAGRTGFRTVNRSVLKHANCTVGILVDRSGHRRAAGTSTVSLNVAVIFLGGDDDYEALAFAGIIAQHQGLNVMVVRFIADEDAVVKARKRRLPATRPQVQMRADDEAFGKFYHKFVATNMVGYIEKTVENGAELVRTLREMENEYDLFVVGQGRDRESVLTAGMTDWAEFPELGPIGDVLAASDFSNQASVLVIRQRNRIRDPEFVDFDFM